MPYTTYIVQNRCNRLTGYYKYGNRLTTLVPTQFHLFPELYAKNRNLSRKFSIQPNYP